jgi:hypothetical protein
MRISCCLCECESLCRILNASTKLYDIGYAYNTSSANEKDGIHKPIHSDCFRTCKGVTLFKIGRLTLGKHRNKSGV